MQQPFNNLLNSSQRANVIKSGLFHGNPRKYQIDAMTKPNEICRIITTSGVLNKYYNMPYQSFISLSGVTAKKELVEMIALQATVTKDILKFIQKCEDDHASVWVDTLKRLELPEIEKQEIQYFIDATDGILYSLKYYYQRPRPEQLAYFYGINLYPLLSTNACSPAYPSGHTFDAYKIAHLLGKRHPEKSAQLLEVAESISMSRIQGGVHYPSDAIISKMMARELVDLGYFDNFLQYSK